MRLDFYSFADAMRLLGLSEERLWGIIKCGLVHLRREASELRFERREIDRLAKEPRIVHALYEGLPVCDFTRQVPRDWPWAHSWVRIDEFEKITCPDCKSQVAQLK